MDGVPEKELSDIELCYKAMGLSFSDNPEQVSKTYRKLKEEYTRAMHSSDSAERHSAAENLKQLEELFSTITESLIYKDYAREYEKYLALKAEERAERKLKQDQHPVVKEALIDCPFCHKPIPAKVKMCMYCHGKIVTPLEKLMAKLFSTRNLIIVFVAAVLIGVGIVFVVNPQLIENLKK